MVHSPVPINHKEQESQEHLSIHSLKAHLLRAYPRGDEDKIIALLELTFLELAIQTGNEQQPPDTGCGLLDLL